MLAGWAISAVRIDVNIGNGVGPLPVIISGPLLGFALFIVMSLVYRLVSIVGLAIFIAVSTLAFHLYSFIS